MVSAFWRPPGAAARTIQVSTAGCEKTFVLHQSVSDREYKVSEGPILPWVSMLVAPQRGALAGYIDVEFVPSDKGAR
jgi:hypothetical protein